MRLLAPISLLLLASCSCMNTAADPAPPPPAVVQGEVTDMAAFEAFIATRPTPAQFRSTYPDVQLVLPGDIASKELRLNKTRYFAELDAEGRISGGRFG